MASRQYASVDLARSVTTRSHSSVDAIYFILMLSSLQAGFYLHSRLKESRNLGSAGEYWYCTSSCRKLNSPPISASHLEIITHDSALINPPQVRNTKYTNTTINHHEFH
jgi:hypothetical protein